jgi:hypothetical protein
VLFVPASTSVASVQRSRQRRIDDDDDDDDDDGT